MMAASIVQQHSQHLAFYRAIDKWDSLHIEEFNPHNDFSSQYDDELNREPITRNSYLFRFSEN